MKQRGKVRWAALVVAGMMIFSAGRVRADGIAETWITEEVVPTAAAAQEIPAKSAVLMDAGSGQLLFEKNAHQPMPPASITKIMTLLLVMEAIEDGQLRWEDTAVCSDHAASMGGSQIWLEPGETMTVEELFKAAAVKSANDASMVLAEQVSGSESTFVKQMNARAKALGMKDTVFKNPTGLDAEGHVSTAYDIALMSRELLKHPEVTRYTTIWMDSLRDGKTSLVNTNKLVRFYEGCTGLKTGTTDGAGSCLSASATRQGLNLIAVSMGSDTSDQRFSACKTLLNYGFASFESFQPEVPAEELIPADVIRGVEEQVELKAGSCSPVLIPKGKGAEVTRTVTLPESVEAPVKEGAVLGEAIFSLEGRILARIPLTAASGVNRMDFFTAFSLLLKSLLG